MMPHLTNFNLYWWMGVMKNLPKVTPVIPKPSIQTLTTPNGVILILILALRPAGRERGILNDVITGSGCLNEQINTEYALGRAVSVMG